LFQPNFQRLKIEQLIVQYLYQNKEVTLQGIGTFRLNPLVELPTDTSKDFVMPEDAFEFEDNQKATEDEGLVDYIVKSGKIRSLAISDIDSYVTLSKQFLNIGNPLFIEGVGTIQKNRQENYLFTSGQFVNSVVNTAPNKMKERKDEVVSFQTEGKSDDNRKLVLILIGLVVIVLTTLGIYYLFSSSSDKEEETAAPAVTAPIAPVRVDSVDTAKKIVPFVKPDSNVSTTPANNTSFKIVLHEYSKADPAQKEFDKLKAYGNKVVLIKKDTNDFLIVMPFTRSIDYAPIAKDSLSKLLGCKAYILTP
jgi:uncharacterized protein (UPF0333 family)